MNKRHFERVHFLQRVHIQPQNEQAVESLCLDISMRGALLVLPENVDWSLNQQLEVTLVLSELEQIIMQGHVAHIDEEVLGYVIDSMDLESMTNLRLLLQHNLGDKEVNREISELLKGQLPQDKNDTNDTNDTH